MATNVLREVAASQEPAVAAKSTAVIRQVRAWAAGYSQALQSRVSLVALIFTAAAPFASLSSLTVAAKLGVWAGAIDDLFDEHLLPAPALARVAANYAERAAGHGRPRQAASDPLGSALEDIIGDLQRFPMFVALRSSWSETLARTLDAMAWEDDVSRRYRSSRRSCVLPSYAEYMERGYISSVVSLYAVTAMVSLDDRSVLDRLAAMHQLEVEAATCVRLANDLGTHAKEVDEGKVNSLIIHHAAVRSEGVSDAAAWRQARGWVRAQSIAALGRARNAARHVQTESGQPEAAVLGVASVASGIYERYEFDADLRDPPIAATSDSGP